MARGARCVVATVLASCGGSDGVIHDASVDMMTADAPDGYTEVARVPVTANRDLDILWVLDDSPGVLDLQFNLKNNAPSFFNVLNSIEGGFPNIHMGVISADLGTMGADGVSGPGIGTGPGSCSADGKNGELLTNGSSLLMGYFIADTKNTDGTRTKNYTGTLEAAFSAIASVGAGGCQFQQPLEAARRALTNNPANTGFRRPQAHLAVLFVTDADDCSFTHGGSGSMLLDPDASASTFGPMQPFRCTRFGVTCATGGATTYDMNTVGDKSGCTSNDTSGYLTRIADYPAFFNGLGTSTSSVFIGTIAAPTAPVAVELRPPPGGGTAIPALAHSCSWTGANGVEAADPPVRLLQLADSMPHRVAGSACMQDLSEPLVNLALGIRRIIGDACITQSLPMPLDCVAAEASSNGATTAMPACAGSAVTPCWELVSDPVACAAGSHTKLNVRRTAPPPPDSIVTLRCRL